MCCWTNVPFCKSGHLQANTNNIYIYIYFRTYKYIYIYIHTPSPDWAEPHLGERYGGRRLWRAQNLPNLTQKALEMQSSDHSPRARHRDLGCATPHHGNLRLLQKSEHLGKPLSSHPKDAARTLAAVLQDEVFNSCLKA